jgi:hypothetical protein
MNSVGSESKPVMVRVAVEAIEVVRLVVNVEMSERRNKRPEL